jgi:hypothetical protein
MSIQHLLAFWFGARLSDDLDQPNPGPAAAWPAGARREAQGILVAALAVLKKYCDYLN